MAGNIKGITIEFAGDTSKLDKSLREVSKNARAIDKELKQVDKALKLNPTSVDVWRQKQDLLKKKIQETERQLDLLKQKQANMDAAGVDKNSAEYRKLQREIATTESKLKTFEGELRAIGNVNLRAASVQFEQMGNKLESAGRAMQGLSMAAAAVVAAIGALTVKSGKWADDINTMSKVYHIGTGELQKYSAAADLVDVDVETIAKSHTKLEKSMASAAKGTGANAEAFDKLGVSVTDANGNLRSGAEVWKDVIAALGQVENETERDALAMQLMGKSAAELNPLIEDGGKTYQNLADTLAKYDLDFIDQETLDQANAFNDSLDTIKAVGMVAFQQLGTQLAAYLAPVMEKVVDLVGRLAGWFTELSPRTQAIIAAIAGVVAVAAPLLIGLGKVSFAISSILSLMATLGPAIGGIVAAMGPIVLAIAAVIAIGVLLYKNWDLIKAKALELKNWVVTQFNLLKTQAIAIFTAIKTQITAIWTAIKTNVMLAVNTLKTGLSTAWTAIKTTATTIWSGIKTAITTAVTTLKTSVTSAFSSLKGSVSATWNAIKTAITSPINTAVSLVKAGIAKLKSIINGAHFSLPHIKLPHFSISGKLSLNPPSIPKVSVSWYKTGGIFDSPTIAGIGEAGPEAVVPLDKLWNKLDNIAAAAASGDSPTIVINAAPGMDINQIATAVEQVLVRREKQRVKAWGY